MKEKQINQNWKEFELGELLKLKGGFAFKSSDFVDDGIPLVKISNFNNSEVDLSKSVKVSKDFLDKYAEFKLSENDLVIAMSGATTGKIGVVTKKNIPCLLNQRVGKFEINSKNLYWRYLKVFIKSKSFQKDIFGIAGGCAQPNISSKQIEATFIPLPILPDGTPDLKKQKQIVAILKKAEGLKDKRKGLDELFDEYLKSVFGEMFLEEDFENVGMGDEKICLISGEYGSGASAINYDGKNRYIRITDIKESGRLKDEQVSPSRVEKKYFLKRGDLLFARSGATVGKTYLHDSEESNYQYAGYLIRYRFNDKVIPEYIYYYTKTPHYLGWVSSKQKVVAQPNINAKQYSSLNIPLPPIKLQEKFASIVSQVEKIKDKLKDEKKDADELFNALMQKAFSEELI